ncbi:MAG: acyltransferase [Rhodospirillales bacterium]|nr:acyltransferase [Rhodospirillales bacterium]
MSQGKVDNIRNPYIHGLRGVLAMMLVVFHVVNSGLPTFDGAVATLFHDTFMTFERGVELFFCISGVVIVFAYQKDPSIRDFAINRITRIFPVLWASIFVILGLSVFQSDHYIPSDPLTVLGNLFVLPPIVPIGLIHPAAWSLSYEFSFYSMFILFSLVALVFPRKLAFVVVGVAALTLIYFHPRTVFFAIGVLIALLSGVLLKDKPETENRGRKLFGSGAVLFLSVFTCHMAFSALDAEGHVTLLNFLTTPYAALLFVLALAFALYGLTGVFIGAGLFSRFLILPPAQYLGTISYSLYLWQTVTMAIIKKAMYVLNLPDILGEWSQLGFFLLALGPTLIVSHYSQKYIERDFTRWLRKGLMNMRWTTIFRISRVKP